MNSAPIQFRNVSLCPVLLNFNPNKFLTKRIEYLNSHFSRLLHISLPTHCPSWTADKNGSDHLMKMSDTPACPLRKRLRLLLLNHIPKNRNDTHLHCCSHHCAHDHLTEAVSALQERRRSQGDMGTLLLPSLWGSMEKQTRHSECCYLVRR